MGHLFCSMVKATTIHTSRLDIMMNLCALTVIHSGDGESPSTPLIGCQCRIRRNNMHLQVTNDYLIIKAESVTDGVRLGIVTKTLDLNGFDYTLMGETTLELPLNKREKKSSKKN